MFQIKAKLVYNKRIKGNYWRGVLQAAPICEGACPGQFVMLKVGRGLQPLLRRPLGIHQVKGKTFEILYEVIGKGTEILSARKPGEYLEAIGPLGNGFNCRGRRPVLVAGGMGVAPLLFLAQRLAREKITVLLGARSKNQILCEKEFKRLGCDVKIATDDGSRGFKGKVTGLLNKLVSTVETIYACGPRTMLKEISRISRVYRLPAEISLEEHMACGFGACLGCTVNTIYGYKRVCKDGPVFKAEEIKW